MQPTAPPVASPPDAPRLVPIVPAPGNEHLHELRVRIPVDLHRQLLSLKILRGMSLAETVAAALDVYFQEHARPADAAAETRAEAGAATVTP